MFLNAWIGLLLHKNHGDDLQSRVWSKCEHYSYECPTGGERPTVFKVQRQNSDDLVFSSRFLQPLHQSSNELLIKTDPTVHSNSCSSTNIFMFWLIIGWSFTLKTCFVWTNISVLEQKLQRSQLKVKHSLFLMLSKKMKIIWSDKLNICAERCGADLFWLKMNQSEWVSIIVLTF